MIRFWIDVKAVAVVGPEYRGETELDVPGVAEHGQGVGQGQLQFLGADGGELRPGEVTPEAPLIHRPGAGMLSVPGDNMNPPIINIMRMNVHLANLS